MQTAARLHESPWTLVRRAAGSPTQIAGKTSRLARIVAGYLDARTFDARLERLHRLGHIPRIPTRVQLAVGAIDMLRFWISPAAADYYRSRNIDYAFHQLLRFLDEPASLADPIGFFSTRDGIIGHLMQVVHANPVYDLQLLEMFDDGLDSLESQLVSMLAGTHPRAVAIGAIVEEPDYHERLLTFVRAWRCDRRTPPMLRENVEQSPTFAVLEKTFGSMDGAMNYFCTLPTSLAGAIHHLRTVHEFVPRTNLSVPLP